MPKKELKKRFRESVEDGAREKSQRKCLKRSQRKESEKVSKKEPEKRVRESVGGVAREKSQGNC